MRKFYSWAVNFLNFRSGSRAAGRWRSAGAVDDLSPVGSALFEDCDRLPGSAIHTVPTGFPPSRPKVLRFRWWATVSRRLPCGDALGHLAGHLFAHGAVAGDVRGVDAQQFGF